MTSDDSIAAVRDAFATSEEPVSAEEFIDRANVQMPPGMRLIGAECVQAHVERGELWLRFTLDEQFSNVVGFIGGGYVAQMLDQSATYAATMLTGRAAPSTNLSASFIAPARPGTFECLGRVIRAGKSVAFLYAELFDQTGQLVATASVTSQLMSRKGLADRARKAQP
ncbi:PaaI family thioesterase [Saccharopolyspora sp. K220]|uniref:PaaI family thioesterase n=1 Tax=Saccharopolyspora soli TaxID=2926618 RepID=UPI001F5923EB|nr:hotdog domain-containing protein [Saccharopolyspora soli]MCI2422960.1 PaaI family thioesterase [Saccharopolyspora soli]